MSKVVDQMNAGDYTVLFLTEAVPLKAFRKVVVDGVEYVPELVYDAENCIAVASGGNFKGKTIKFE